MAKLTFRYGAMNSGKSTALLQVAYNYDEQGMRVLVIKPGIDTKGGIKITSRTGLERQVDVIVSESADIIKLLESKLEKIEAILVDEAQFLSGEQIDQLSYIAAMLDVAVICFGLRNDFQSNAFAGSARLLAIADELEELRTVCRCGKKATHNARKVNGRFVFDGDQVAIDGEGSVEYESMCRRHFLEYKQLASIT